MRRLILSVALLAAALALPGIAYAQNAQVTGTLKDQSGAVLPGVTVTAKNDATGLTRLNLLQGRRDLEVELATMQAGTPDLSGLEKDFVKVAKAYSAKKKISYGAWREFGVPPETLKKAGITRAS